MNAPGITGPSSEELLDVIDGETGAIGREQTDHRVVVFLRTLRGVDRQGQNLVGADREAVEVDIVIVFDRQPEQVDRAAHAKYVQCTTAQAAQGLGRGDGAVVCVQILIGRLRGE